MVPEYKQANYYLHGMVSDLPKELGKLGIYYPVVFTTLQG